MGKRILLLPLPTQPLLDLMLLDLLILKLLFRPFWGLDFWRLVSPSPIHIAIWFIFSIDHIFPNVYFQSSKHVVLCDLSRLYNPMQAFIRYNWFSTMELFLSNGRHSNSSLVTSIFTLNKYLFHFRFGPVPVLRL